jgi:hypothetical protein
MIRQAEGGNHAGTAKFRAAEANKEDLIFVVVNLARELAFEFGLFGIGEIAFEDGILEMGAEAFADFEDLPEPLVVADIVGDDVSQSHDSLAQVPQKEPQNTIFLGNERLKSRIHTREGWLMGVE